MRLSGEDDLHVPPRRRENADQALLIAEYQLGALVGGKPPREPNRQRPGIEQRPRSHDRRGADIFLRPSIARALADKREQESFERRARAPQLLVRDVENLVPELGIVGSVEPLGADMALEQLS